MELTQTRLAKSKTGYWEVRWSERLAGGGWRSKSVSCRTTSKSDAELFRRAWVAAEARDRRELTGVSVADLISQYLSLLPDDSGQRWALKPIVAYFGQMAPEDIQTADVMAYRASREALGRAGGTIRRELGALTAAFNAGVRAKILERDKVPYLPMPPDGQGRVRFLPEDEEARLWDLASANADAGRAERFICIALATAARKRAIETLTWDRVDFSTWLIDFKDVSLSASKKRRVMIPVAERLKPVLGAARVHAGSTGYVLDSPGDIRREYKRFMVGAGFGHITPHDLRRTWATLRARRGVPLWDIAAVLGDTVETVIKHYAVHQPEHLRGAID